MRYRLHTRILNDDGTLVDEYDSSTENLPFYVKTTDVLEFEHSTEIRFYLQKALTDEGLGGLIRAKKS